ncbi:MAG: Ig-like domain-containing protein [Cyclobacteriaceae bacterium]
MKKLLFFIAFALLAEASSAQNGHELILPDSAGWNNLYEGKTLAFKLRATSAEDIRYFSFESGDKLPVHFDSVGNFSWKISYDLVNRVEQKKDFTVIFQALWKDGKRARETVTFTVNHVNRAPVVEEIPMFYVKQSTRNSYQIPYEYVSDPDGDPFVFKIIQTQMPEGANLSSQGQFTWSPSRSQFNSLKNNPLTVEFIVQDQPDKAETKGRIRIAQTQLDLPPELLIVPGDSVFTLKEDETLNLKIYISDPNGDENVRSAGFIPSDLRIVAGALKENTPLQYEFTWKPPYTFVEETQKQLPIDIVFFALDKSNNRAQRKISITVTDAENVVEKDAHQYQKYRANLVSAYMLIRDLDENQKKLNEEYKRAKKGKKKRSIVNASLGAVTGLSPVMIDATENPDAAKIVPGVGGTAVLTLGTLEATEVIGRSKDDIMEKIKISIDIRNKVQTAGDEFARKYGLKSARRQPEFEKEIEKLRTAITDQRIVLLEMDAYRKNPPKIEDKDLKKTFPDFAQEN